MSPRVVDAMAKIGTKLYSWDFNMFEVDRATGRRPLFVTTMALLKSRGLLEGWLLDEATMANFLTAAEAAYRSNPYHNAAHAADVTQTAAVIANHVDAFLLGGGKGEQQQQQQQQRQQQQNNNGQQQQQQADSGGGGGAELSQLEWFCVIFASAVHDLGHPGVNNDYLVRTRDAQALTYNDRSVNENMHCARAFELALQQPGCNVFARFSEAEYSKARALIIAIVLSTDMAVHFDLLNRFVAVSKSNPDPRTWAAPERQLLLQMAVHLADLANPARPFPLAAAWAERVVTEFLAQGDAEAAKGLAVSAPCDRSVASMPRAQLGFMALFAQPTLEAFAVAAPSFDALVAPYMAETKVKWEFLLESGVRHPCGGEYPPFTDEVEQRVAEAREKAAAAAAARAAEWAQRREAAAAESSSAPPV